MRPQTWRRRHLPGCKQRGRGGSITTMVLMVTLLSSTPSLFPDPLPGMHASRGRANRQLNPGKLASSIGETHRRTWYCRYRLTASAIIPPHRRPSTLLSPNVMSKFHTDSLAVEESKGAGADAAELLRLRAAVAAMQTCLTCEVNGKYSNVLCIMRAEYFFFSSVFFYLESVNE